MKLKQFEGRSLESPGTSFLPFLCTRQPRPFPLIPFSSSCATGKIQELEEEAGEKAEGGRKAKGSKGRLFQ
jgi:hypothetical protein